MRYAFILVLINFGFPETKWRWAHPDEIQREAVEGSISPTIDDDMVQAVDASDFEKKNSSPVLSDHRPLPHQEIRILGRVHRASNISCSANSMPIQLRTFFLNFEFHKIFVYPIVLIASFRLRRYIFCRVFPGHQSDSNLAATPYHYSSERVGLFNIAILKGAMIILATAGPLQRDETHSSKQRDKRARNEVVDHDSLRFDYVNRKLDTSTSISAYLELEA